MIIKGNLQIAGVMLKNTPISKIYLARTVLWEKQKPQEEPIEDPTITEILSCYHNGYWIDEYPWTDDTPWTD